MRLMPYIQFAYYFLTWANIGDFLDGLKARPHVAIFDFFTAPFMYFSALLMELTPSHKLLTALFLQLIISHSKLRCYICRSGYSGRCPKDYDAHGMLVSRVIGSLKRENWSLGINFGGQASK